MKNLLFVFFVFVTSVVAAENYVNETARWKQYQTWYGFGQSSITNTEYYFNGDTTINGIVYYKLWSDVVSNYTTITYDSLGNQIPTTTTNSNSGLAGYFREFNKKFYLIANNNPELMLYNFDVEIGAQIDSISTNSYCGTIHPLLMNVDTVCIGSIGRKRWTISFSTYPAASSFIEGVGPNSGFRASICRNGCPECGYGLNLFTMNGDTLYQGICSIQPNSIIEQQKNEKLVTIINENEILIYANNLKEILVYNNIGQIVSAFTNINSSQLTINTNNLRKGIYFINARVGDEVQRKSVYIR